MRSPWKPGHDQQRRQRRHRHHLDQRPRHQHDERHGDTRKDVRPARLGAGAHQDRGARDRTARRHPAHERRRHIACALPKKVARHVRVLAVGVGNALADTCTLNQADQRQREGGQQHVQHEIQARQCYLGESAGDGADITDPLHQGKVQRFPVDSVQCAAAHGGGGIGGGLSGHAGGDRVDHSPQDHHQQRGDGDGDNERKLAQARAQQHDDQGQCEQTDQCGRHVRLVHVQCQVERLCNAVGVGAVIARQVAQLAEDDQHGDAVEEADHHRIGDKAHQEAEPKEAGRDLKDPHQQHHHRQGFHLPRCGHAGEPIGGGDRQRAGGGHIHVYRAGEEGGDRHSRQQRVDAQDGVYRRQEGVRHGLRHVDHGEGQPGDCVCSKIAARGRRRLGGGSRRLHMRGLYPKSPAT